jgi:hypothetical protein
MRRVRLRLLSTTEKTAVSQQVQVGIDTKLMTRPGNVGGSTVVKGVRKNEPPTQPKSSNKLKKSSNS